MEIIVKKAEPEQFQFVVRLPFKQGKARFTSVRDRIQGMIISRAMKFDIAMAFDIPMLGDIQISDPDFNRVAKFRNSIKPLIKRLEEAGFLYSEEELKPKINFAQAIG